MNRKEEVKMLRKKLKESMITDKGNRRSPKRLKIAHKPAEMQSSGWVEPMTFHPTLAEFRDLPKYDQSLWNMTFNLAFLVF